MSRFSSACAAVGVGEESSKRRRAALPCPSPAADLGYPSLRAGAELPRHRTALVGITVHLPRHFTARGPWEGRVSTRLLTGRCAGWRALLYTCAKTQRCTFLRVSTAGAAGGEFFQSEGWIFVATSFKPAFKLQLSTV